MRSRVIHLTLRLFHKQTELQQKTVIAKLFLDILYSAMKGCIAFHNHLVKLLV